MRDDTDTSTEAQAALAAHADAIRTIGKRVIADVIEIGRRLAEAKKIVGHGGWLPWLDREFGWSDETARKFMRGFEVAGDKFQQNWDLPVSALYLISKPSTPDSARDAVLDLAAKGERVTHAQAKDIVNSEKNRARPILREMKLGKELVAKIKGTSLDKARELDELIMLNRGAPQGEQTPVVAKLVADAAAGKNVSAVATTAQRGEVARLKAQIEELHRQLALKDQQLVAKDRRFEELHRELALKDQRIAALERQHTNAKRGPAASSKFMTGRELAFRAKNPDPAQLALLQTDLQSGNVPVHKFTLEQARQLVPLQQRRATTPPHDHSASSAATGSNLAPLTAAAE